MSAIADVNGDGIPDMIVPAPGFRQVVLVTFAGGVLAELGRATHTAEVVTNIVVGRAGIAGSGGLAAVYGLSDGTVAVLPLPVPWPDGG